MEEGRVGSSSSSSSEIVGGMIIDNRIQDSRSEGSLRVGLVF